MIDEDNLMLVLCVIGVFTAVLSLACFIDGSVSQGIVYLVISAISYLGGWALDED